jgi:CRP-like cAMP-binding protein
MWPPFVGVALIEIIDHNQSMSLPHLEYRARNASFRVTPERWRRHPFVIRLERCIVLSDDDLGSLLRLIEGEVVVEKRRDVVVDGYEYRKLCFVEDGFAARYKLLRNGKRQIVNLVLPGDIIGLPSSFLEKAHYSVTAITDLKLQVTSINAYVDLCYRRPQFALALSWLAMQEAISCAEHAISTGRRTPVERLAHFLLEIYWRLALVGLASKSRFDLPFSQEVMSDALGLSVPHLNRTLAKLRIDGLINLNGRCVEFPDISSLELLGHFQPLNLTRVPPAPNQAPSLTEPPGNPTGGRPTR